MVLKIAPDNQRKAIGLAPKNAALVGEGVELRLGVVAPGDASAVKAAGGGGEI